MKIVLLFIVLSVSLNSMALNKTFNICGEYIYSVPANMSLEDAKRIAIDRAKISALAEKFGTLISQNNITVVKNGDGQSSVNFKSLSASEVKGEWIEDTKIPLTNISYEKDMLVIKANVCGKAREITRAAINFRAKLLANGVDDKFENNVFKDGDQLYLSFQSPVDGYLSVYLIDEEQTAFCLLPYIQDSDGLLPIKHNQRVVFFDANEPTDRINIEEFILTSVRSVENNDIYIVFSPNPFTKSIDNQLQKDLPRELSFVDFQRWLVRNRNIDKDMEVEIKTIQIRK